MASWVFASDLHGKTERYRSLLRIMAEEIPQAVLLGGDLLPHAMDSSWSANPDHHDFLADFLTPALQKVQATLGPDYPQIFLILGNDDPAFHEETLREGEQRGLWQYVHGRQVEHLGFTILGYNCIPPSPFQLKDWERYDVSRYVDPGCLSPEEGRHTGGLEARDLRHTTMAQELKELSAGVADFRRTILLSHCPPYDCPLDRAALDGKTVDHVPLDVHIGSIAIKRFIEDKQPLLT
nr:hypothetical protein [Candidatus Krumholzibacteria bacterium]